MINYDSVVCVLFLSGADVVGSDIDADGLLGGGMIPLTSDNTINTDKDSDITPVRGVLPPNQRSKNVNFTRKGGRSQLGLCTMDNFKHYKLQDRVLDLIGAGVDQWLLNKNGSGETGRDPKILKYNKVIRYHFSLLGHVVVV